jgi:hypothetical protein
MSINGDDTDDDDLHKRMVQMTCTKKQKRYIRSDTDDRE